MGSSRSCLLDTPPPTNICFFFKFIVCRIRFKLMNKVSHLIIYVVNVLNRLSPLTSSCLYTDCPLYSVQGLLFPLAWPLLLLLCLDLCLLVWIPLAFLQLGSTIDIPVSIYIIGGRGREGGSSWSSPFLLWLLNIMLYVLVRIINTKWRAPRDPRDQRDPPPSPPCYLQFVI